jgi:hypothetical protein
MREEYVIQAYSPSTNQTIREFNLEMNNPSIKNKIEANQIASAFAYRLNKQKYLQATDWTPRVEFQQLGIETIPGYIPNK